MAKPLEKPRKGTIVCKDVFAFPKIWDYMLELPFARFAMWFAGKLKYSGFRKIPSETIFNDALFPWRVVSQMAKTPGILPFGIVATHKGNIAFNEEPI